jgi:hypothetical protein
MRRVAPSGAIPLDFLLVFFSESASIVLVVVTVNMNFSTRRNIQGYLILFALF